MSYRHIGRAALAAGWVWFAAPSVQACAVCFGRTDSPLGKGLHWGVLALLCFVVGTLAAFGAFAVYLVRRSMAVEAAEEIESERAAGGVVPNPEIH